MNGGQECGCDIAASGIRLTTDSHCALLDQILQTLKMVGVDDSGIVSAKAWFRAIEFKNSILQCLNPLLAAALIKLILVKKLVWGSSN